MMVAAKYHLNLIFISAQAHSHLSVSSLKMLGLNPYLRNALQICRQPYWPCNYQVMIVFWFIWLILLPSLCTEAKDGIQGHVQSYFIHPPCQVWEKYSVSMKATFEGGEVGIPVFCGKTELNSGLERTSVLIGLCVWLLNVMWTLVSGSVCTRLYQIPFGRVDEWKPQVGGRLGSFGQQSIGIS